MQVQFYSMNGPQLLYPTPALLASSQQQQQQPQPPPLPQNPLFVAFPQPQSQQHLMLAQLPSSAAAAAAAAAAAYFTQAQPGFGGIGSQLAVLQNTQQQQQQQQQALLAAAGLGILSPLPIPQHHLPVPAQPLKSPPAQSTISSSVLQQTPTKPMTSPIKPGIESSGGQKSGPDYSAKLLTWLKAHRMHKYHDRLKKYSFDRLLSLDRADLEAEQFTQGAIKKLLGMLDRVRQDQAAFDSPAAAARCGGVGSPGCDDDHHHHHHRLAPYQRRRPAAYHQHQQLQQHQHLHLHQHQLQLLSLAALAQHQQQQQQQLLFALSSPFLGHQLS